MLQYLHEPVKRGGVYWLSIRPDIVLPLTKRGVIEKMEVFLAEAHRFSSDMQGSRVAFRYLGVEANLTSETNPKLALGYWVQNMRRSALQKGHFPRTLANSDWNEVVAVFREHRAQEMILVARDLATMITYFTSTKQRRTLEQALERNWSLMTEGIHPSFINGALYILARSWHHDDIGQRIIMWYKRWCKPPYEPEKLLALFHVVRKSDGDIEIIERMRR